MVKAAKRRGRILLIDDDPLICSFIARTLAEEHEVLTFHSAAEALTRVWAGEQFDVILCDLMMPALTGMQFYERLAQARNEHAARIVFLTGGAFNADAAEFLGRVDNVRLEKPFSLEGLRALVNAHVG